MLGNGYCYFSAPTVPDAWLVMHSLASPAAMTSGNNTIIFPTEYIPYRYELFTETHLYRHNPAQTAMIQRTLLRQCRAAAARSAPTSFFAGPVIRPAQSFAQVSRQVIAARCYATNGEAEAGKSDASSAEDAAKKDLETKNKEIVDLKVCYHYFHPLFRCNFLYATIYLLLQDLPLLPIYANHDPAG